MSIPRRMREALPPLYKCMELRFAQALCEEGRIRVGTLNDFQQTETHSLGIGDEGEGQREYHLDHSIPGEFDSHPALGPLARGLRGASFQNCQFTDTSVNTYLCSLSVHPSRRLMIEAGYDAVVRISDPLGFARTLGECLRKQLGLARLGKIVSPVRYLDTGDPHDSNVPHPALAKGVDHKHQEEVRILFADPGHEACGLPLILDCRGLGEYVEPVELESLCWDEREEVDPYPSAFVDCIKSRDSAQNIILDHSIFLDVEFKGLELLAGGTGVLMMEGCSFTDVSLKVAPTLPAEHIREIQRLVASGVLDLG